MKTTIELPDDLVKKVKLHALRKGKKLKDAVAELLRKGLKADNSVAVRPSEPKLVKHPKMGFLMFSGGHRPAKGDELTPERIDEILLAQEVEWHNDTCR